MIFFSILDLVVDSTATNARLARPRINVRTGLTRLHVSHTALVPEIADFSVVALFWPVLRTF